MPKKVCLANDTKCIYNKSENLVFVYLAKLSEVEAVVAVRGYVCKTVKKDEHSHVNNARICTEGPVFDASDVEI